MRSVKDLMLIEEIIPGSTLLICHDWFSLSTSPSTPELCFQGVRGGVCKGGRN
jgi:hypothetical protein